VPHAPIFPRCFRQGELEKEERERKKKKEKGHGVAGLELATCLREEQTSQLKKEKKKKGRRKTKKKWGRGPEIRL